MVAVILKPRMLKEFFAGWSIFRPLHEALVDKVDRSRAERLFESSECWLIFLDRSKDFLVISAVERISASQDRVSDDSNAPYIDLVPIFLPLHDLWRHVMRRSKTLIQ